ncbi:MAG: exodeoxyribonuclease VII large subunit [Phycisphaeraceae bacterium]|nr:exodeoxyribonuclease VII large subunit [Phycisphaeraceae bacterium]MBX3368337.1 exodeoxyribonuclease VII large subunit [Phycisphaeraceae bacterium]
MTGRLPFDPARLPPRSASPSTGLPADRPLTVAELAQRIDGALKGGLPRTIRVVGEISGAVQRTHWYFNAKDDAAVVSCVMFASAASRSRTAIENGRTYVLSGRVEFYAKSGKVSLLVDRIEPIGEGELDAAFRRLCEELRALGWFAPERKRALPAFPRRVAVVTSATGAALQDVIKTAGVRCPAVDIVVVDVRVQGERAAEEVARAIRAIGRRSAELSIDAMIVARGGGSKEDLWTFNERVVAHAIVESPIPVVAAIGHETDTTIAELVADERASTPTQAAMRLTPDRGELLRQVGDSRSRLLAAVRRLLRSEGQRLRSVARQPIFRDPGWLLWRSQAEVGRASERLAGVVRRRMLDGRVAIAQASQKAERISPEVRIKYLGSRLEASAGRLGAALQRFHRERVQRIDAASRQLESVGPRSVLGRGYSWTIRKDGSILRSVSQAAAGDTLTTQLTDGRVESVVGGSTSAELLGRLRGSHASRRRAVDPGTPMLFDSAPRGGGQDQ